MQLNEIFRETQYSEAYEFIVKNNYVIIEIDSDEQGRRFQIQEVPAPTEREMLYQELYESKQLLEKYKEDVEQVELFGMTRSDYQTKKKMCADIVIRLREIEKELREYEQTIN